MKRLLPPKEPNSTENLPSKEPDSTENSPSTEPNSNENLTFEGELRNDNMLGLCRPLPELRETSQEELPS